jgi:hypothetical protein
MTIVRIGFEVLVYANVRIIPEMQGGAGALWAKVCSVKQASREGPLEVWVGIGTYYYFLAQTFFSPQRTRSVGRGRSKCPAYHPPTPYTFSPLLKGGEGRGEGGAYTRMPCPFGALLVALCHLRSKAFLM